MRSESTDASTPGPLHWQAATLMEGGDSQNNASEVSPHLAGAFSENERRALRERAEHARAVASEAVSHYAALLAQSRHRIVETQQTVVAIQATRETIRQSVCEYASLMKSLDNTPERTLRLIKETVAGQLSHPESEAPTGGLMNSVVTWCIEAYYGPSSAA